MQSTALELDAGALFVVHVATQLARLACSLHSRGVGRVARVFLENAASVSRVFPVL